MPQFEVVVSDACQVDPDGGMGEGVVGVDTIIT